MNTQTQYISDLEAENAALSEALLALIKVSGYVAARSSEDDLRTLHAALVAAEAILGKCKGDE